MFRFFDFLFGGSLTALVLFSYNRNAAFLTNVSLAESVSAMWFKDRPRFHYIIALHLSEIANYLYILCYNWAITWCNAFSSPEAALLLVSTKNRDLWPRPTTFRFWMALETQQIDTRTNQICQTWLWACAGWREVRESRTSGFGLGQRSRFLVLTKRSAASGDENGCNDDRTSPWNWHEMNTTIVMDTFDWRPLKLSFWNWKKSL